jgi:flagellar basal-body rod modification protein FlgD
MSSPIMNPISSPSAATPPLASSTSSNTDALAGAAPSEDEFLQLLVAELKNQTPDNTADPTQFVTELAQFAQLGQSTESASDLDAIKAALTGVPSTSAASTTTPASSGTSSSNGVAAN